MTTLSNVVASEWTKLRSVRSTWWTSACTFFVTVGLSALVCWALARSLEHRPDGRAVNALALGLAGVDLGQLAIVVLGVMAMTAEYSSGGIRTTFVAVPQRWKVVAAKAIVVGGLGLALGVVTSATSFAIGQVFLGGQGVGASLGDPGVGRAVVGGGLYLAGTALFGFAVGALLRSTAAAITVAIGALLVLPPLTGILPGDVAETFNRLLPSNAGHRIMEVGTAAPSSLGPWTGFLVFCLWSAALLGAGAALIQRRDA